MDGEYPHIRSVPASRPPALTHPDVPLVERELATPRARLNGVGRAMWRYAWLIVFTLACVNGGAVAVVSMLTPRYTAEAAVLIGAREAQVTDIKAVIAGLTRDSEGTESEIQIVRSRRLARRVVEDLHLDRQASVDAALPNLRQNLVFWLNGLLAQAHIDWRLPVPAGRVAPQDPVAAATDVLLSHLTVSTKGHSRVIGISVEAADPVGAAQAANAVAYAYLDQQLRTKIDETGHARDWLEERVAELRQQARTASEAVEAYRQKSGVLRGANTSIATEQITDIGRQIVQAQVQKANAAARLQTLAATLASRSGLDGLPEVQGSLLIRDLREQEALLTQDAAQIAAVHGSGYPKLAEIRAQVAANHVAQRAELEHMAESFRDAVRTAEARERSLQPILADLRQQVGASKESEIELQGLQQEANADQVLLERLLSRSKETQIEVGLQQPDGQVISPAEPPDAPSFPNPTLILPVFFVGSCMLAALLVLGLDSLDFGFLSRAHVEATLGVAALGIVPRVSQRLLRRISAAPGLQPSGEASYRESIRSLYTSVVLSTAPDIPKVVLFASAHPHEGKTTVLLSLARLMASSGKRVVIIDCDVHRPSLHKAMGVPRSPGLANCLAGQLDLASALRRDPATGVWLLPAGGERSMAPGLFVLEEMARLVRILRSQFDLVLLDSAPVLVMSDTRALARLADKTVFIVRWRATRQRHVREALRQLAAAGGQVAGVLLSMVELHRYDRLNEGLNRRKIRLYLAG